MSITILLILTAIFWGSSPIIEKIGILRTDPLTAVTLRSITVTAILLAVVSLSGKTKLVFTAEPKTFVCFAASGIMAGLLGMWTYYAALKAGATSKIVPLAATYPLVTAILSLIILGEKVTFFRIFGTILIVAGIWIINL